MSSLWHSRGMRLATTLLTVLMMVVIFLFSAETAEESDLTSGFFARILIRVFCPGFNELNEAEQQVVYDQYQTVIRKCAHFTEYLLLGLLLRLCYMSWFGDRGAPGILSWVTGALYAGTDELHQVLIDGRSGQVWDVLIDCGGVFIGVLIAIPVIRMINNAFKRKEDRKNGDEHRACPS